MASVSTDKSGSRRILFVDPNGDRKAVRLGKVSLRSAEGFKTRIEALLECLLLRRSMEADLAGWVTKLDARMAKRLAAVGLIPKPERKAAVTLGEHLKAYFAKRADVKPNTLVHWRHTERLLLTFFSADRALSRITEGDARDWERWLRTKDARENRYGDREATEGLAPNTARKRVANAKQFFQDAVQRDLLAKNPFAGLKATVGSNRDRDYFIDRAAAAKVLEACPDAEWRLIFALSRYAGLRCPSEHLALTWDDVNWSEGKLLIRSSKTEHHEGKGLRLVPIFPELKPYLDAAWAAWQESDCDSNFVITRYRTENANLRTQLERIVKQAGLTPWPKTFQNLRSSRATELANEHPAHVAAAWLGHSTLVASKHYWQVTDDDFARAVRGDNGDKSAAQKAAQNPAQSMHAGACGESHGESSAHEKTPAMLSVAPSGDTMQNPGDGRYRTRTIAPNSGNNGGPSESGAESGALGAREAPLEADLAAVVDAWPTLPEASRQAVLAIIRQHVVR